MKVVGTQTIVLMQIVPIRLFGRHTWKLKSSHQAVHSSDTDVYAIVTLKDVGDLVSAKALVIIGVDLENSLSNVLILLSSVSRFRIEMFVIGASVYTKDSA